MGTLVRAIANGSFNGSRVRKGTEFTLPDGMKPGHWLEVIEPVEKPVEKPMTKAEKAAAAKADAAAGKTAEDLA